MTQPPAQHPPTPGNPPPPPSTQEYICSECAKKFTAESVVNYEGRVVCRRCLGFGPPERKMDSGKRKAILLILLALTPIIAVTVVLAWTPIKSWVIRTAKPTLVDSEKDKADPYFPVKDENDKKIKPGSTRRVDDFLRLVLRTNNVKSIATGAMTADWNDLFLASGSRKTEWERFATNPSKPIEFLNEELPKWKTSPVFIEIELVSKEDQWRMTKEVAGRIDRSDIKRYNSAEGLLKPINLSGSGVSHLFQDKGIYWVRTNYVSIAMSDMDPVGYIRGIRIHTQAFLDAHKPKEEE